MSFDLFYEIQVATQQWKLAHQVEGKFNAAPSSNDQIRESAPASGRQASGDMGSTLIGDALTFADIPLGEEFVDEDGLTWEKRSETRAISWYQYEQPDVIEFKPDAPVRVK